MIKALAPITTQEKKTTMNEFGVNYRGQEAEERNDVVVGLWIVGNDPRSICH